MYCYVSQYLVPGTRVPGTIYQISDAHHLMVTPYRYVPVHTGTCSVHIINIPESIAWPSHADFQTCSPFFNETLLSDVHVSLLLISLLFVIFIHTDSLSVDYAVLEAICKFFVCTQCMYTMVYVSLYTVVPVLTINSTPIPFFTVVKAIEVRGSLLPGTPVAWDTKLALD